MLCVGIDVGGYRKGLHLALLVWAADNAAASVAFEHLSLKDCPRAEMQTVREAVAAGDIFTLAEATYASAHAVGKLISSLPVDILGAHVAVDCPSGFARNCIGHGRATERLAAKGFGNFRVPTQMTPSLNVARPHNGKDWSWLILGMAVFAYTAQSLNDFAGWLKFLHYGPANTMAKEAFPSATIQYLRHENSRTYKAIGQLTRALRADCPQGEVNVLAVVEALVRGPTILSKNDYSAALVAAYSALPDVMPETYDRLMLRPRKGIVRHELASGGWEGAIILPRIRVGVVV